MVARTPQRITEGLHKVGMLAIGSSGAILFTNAGAPTSGTSGTKVGVAGPGSLCIDVTASVGMLYINTGTLASPTWTKVGTQS